MNSNEWPLVFFTMLSQISVGLILGGLLLWAGAKNTGTANFDTFKKALLISAFITMGIALLISFFHLSSPLHSVYSLSNIGKSWLSREIILASLYLFSLAVCYLSLRYNIPHRNIFGHFYLASALTGIILIYAMSRVYMISTTPLWNTPATLVAFFNTTILLGGSALLLVLIIAARAKGDMPELQPLFNLLFFMISAGVFIGLLNMLLLQPDPSGIAGSFAAPELSGIWKISQTIFLLAGYSTLAWWFAFRMPQYQGSGTIILIIAITCIFLSELAGRYLFYASYYRIGV